MADSDRQRKIIELIRVIPEGFVTTYGDLCPEAPRLPGAVLRLTDESVPWHRVVRADGSWAKADRQRSLLEGEGVPLKGDRVDLTLAHVPREALLDLLSAGSRPGHRVHRE